MANFELSDTEIKNKNTWLKRHNKKCKYSNPLKCGASGGRLTYMFTGTSLGVIVKVKCVCGEESDISDYGSW